MARPFLADWREALLDSDLDKTSLLVGFVLSTFANAAGSCHPGKLRLARDSRYSKRAVDGAINRLEAAGLIEVSRSRGGSQNGYQLTLPTVQVGARLRRSNGADGDTQRCSQRHGTVQVAAPKSAESAESVTTPEQAHPSGARLSVVCECGTREGNHASWCKAAA